MRTVLTVDPTGEIDPVLQTERMVVKVERHAVSVPKMTNVQPLTLPPMPDWSTANAVAERGKLLREALRKHAGIAGVLDNLAVMPAGNVNPIYVKLNEGDAELITWETLCDLKDAFVALDRRWPIGRITDPASTRTRGAPLFRFPIRLLAVISAFGIANQAREWRFLRDALSDARTAGLDVLLRVLVGEDALFDAITKDIAGGLPWVQVASITGTGARVVSEISKWKPNVVHFFCHGRSDAGKQELEFATASDYKDPNLTQGSVTVGVDQLVDLGLELDNPWLMTLNCCEGAHASDDLTSIAYQVVSTAFPAAVAMLEPVDASDAYEFTRALYGSLFGELAKVNQALKVSAAVEFEWAQVTHDARTAINDLHHGDAANRKEWALPALYVRGVDPMRFERPPAAETEQEQLHFVTAARTVAGWLNSVRDSMPEDQRLAVMSATLVGVPKQYWPETDGTFRA
jgi:CHAT domain